MSLCLYTNNTANKIETLSERRMNDRVTPIHLETTHSSLRAIRIQHFFFFHLRHSM